MQFLLVTDLDNTLVGDKEATLILNKKLAPLRADFYLIYATGRSLTSAHQLQQEQQLLEPDYWVTGVGTEIYSPRGQDLTWAEQLNLGWYREEILQQCTLFPHLIPQDTLEQNPWKISFCLEKGADSSFLEDLHQRLQQIDSRAQIIFSSGQDVDIIPQRADKGRALTYLRESLQVSANHTLACGDSGNDISLFQQKTPGTIVSNAQRELLHWYQDHAPSNLYLASSPYAWGILEGLRYFNFLS